MKIVPLITINLLNPPRPGQKQLVVRLPQEDINQVNRAAAILGMSQGEFMRTVLVRSAGAILREVGET
jgi:uncharacterized protein (DUF1778 family)